MDNIFELPELLHEVARHVPPVPRLHLALTNKTSWRSQEFFRDKVGKYGKYQLKFDQLELLEKLSISKKNMLVRAPASFGKTLIALIHILDGYKPQKNDDGSMKPLSDEDRVLLLVAPNHIRMFLEKVQELFPELLSRNPQNSAIVFDNSCMKQHYELINKENYLPHWKLVVMSPRRLYSSWKRGIDLEVILKWFGQLVIDEAHTEGDTMIYWSENNVGRFIALSANSYSGLDFDKLRMEADNVLQPTLYHNLEELEIEDTVIADAIPKYEQKVIDSSVEEFLEAGNYTRLVVFLPKKSDYEKYQKFIPDGVPLFKFSSALRPIERFMKETKAVLFTSYGLMMTGHNLLVDQALLVDPERYDYENIYQVISRFLRITNTHKLVTINFITDRPMLLRLRIACANLKRNEGFNEYINLAIKRCSGDVVRQVIDALKIDPWTLSDYEFLWIASVGTTDVSLNALFRAKGFENDDRKKLIRELYKALK